MAQIKTSELTGVALDWAVAMCNDVLKDATQASNFLELCKRRSGVALTHGRTYTPTTDWAQGGPIIERERIAIQFGPQWTAVHHKHLGRFNYGPTPLIAAMRCYVASKMGDTIEVPDELIK